MPNQRLIFFDGRLFLGTLVAGALLFTIATRSFSQDRALGDVAREARNAHPPKATKVLTDDSPEPKAVTSDDDPLDVINRAHLALVRGIAHRCRDEASGNSGPGWAKTQITEVSGIDRIHVTVTDQGPNSKQGEW